MTLDPLHDLESLWHAEAPAPPVSARLRSRVRRHRGAMMLLTCAEIALSLGVLLMAWPTGAEPAERITFTVLVLIAAVIVVFAVWNRRGAWRADVATPAAYLDWAERRARARLRTARFAQVVVWAQAAGIVTLVAVRRGPAEGPLAVVNAVALALALSLAVVGWAAWYAARARLELADAIAARALLDREAGIPV